MNPHPAAAAPSLNAPPHSAARRFALSPARTAAIALVLVHAILLLAHFAPAIMSPDANGYVAQARLIANEGRTSFAVSSPIQYVGMHWLETRDGVFHSRYPAGLPVLMAAAWKIGGLTGALLVNPLLASATVLLVFLLGQRLAGGWYGLAAAVVYAAIPVANQHALDADAHTAATFFLLAGVLALLRFGDTRSIPCGLLAGVLLGIVPTVRYPEAITGLAIAGWLLGRIRPVTRLWPAVLGAALPLGAVLGHNAGAYGAFWRTGYALTNEQTGFGLEYFARHAVSYLQNLGGGGLALFFAFGAAGIAALAADRRWRHEGLLYAGIVMPLLLVYMAYYFGGPGGNVGVGNLRFLMPTFPFFAVAGAWLLGRIAGHLGFSGRVAVAVVLALQLIVTGVGTLQALGRTKTSITAAARARALAEQHVPAGSVVIVDRLLAESLDAVGTWRLAEENMLAGMGPRGAGGPGPGFRGPFNRNDAEPDAERPMPMQVGKNRAQQERFAGLDPAERRMRAWEDLAAWAGGRPVYWFARSVESMANALPPGADYESIGEVDAPSMAGFGGPGGGGPAGGGPAMMGPARPGRPGFPKGGFAPGGAGGREGPAGFGRAGMPPGPAGELNSPTPKLRLVKITLAR